MDFLQRKALSAAVVVACGLAMIGFSPFTPLELKVIFLAVGLFLIALGVYEWREYRELSRIISLGMKALKKKQRSA